MNVENGLYSKVQPGDSPYHSPKEMGRRGFLTGLAAIAGLGTTLGACATTAPSSPTAYAMSAPNSQVDAASLSDIPNLDGKVFSLYLPIRGEEGTEYVIRQKGLYIEVELLNTPLGSRRARTPVQARATITKKSTEGNFELKGDYYISLFDRPIHDHWNILYDSFLKLDVSGRYVIDLKSRSGLRGSYRRSILVEKQ